MTITTPRITNLTDTHLEVRPQPAPTQFCYRFLGDENKCRTLESWAHLRSLTSLIGSDEYHAALTVADHSNSGLSVETIGDAGANSLLVEVQARPSVREHAAGTSGRVIWTLANGPGQEPDHLLPTSAIFLTRDGASIPIRNGHVTVPRNAVLPTGTVVDAARHWLQFETEPSLLCRLDWRL